MGEAYWADEAVTLYLGKCEDVLPDLPAGSVDAIVTDPPYDLTAGKKGGTGEASLNVSSPAGRSRISTGGFMGKSWDATGVAFDPATWRAALRVLKPGGYLLAFGGTRTWHRMVCAIEDVGFEIRDSVASLTGQDAPGLMWMHGQGFPKHRDALKPAWEPIVVARKPLAAGSVAANVLEWGTGALNIAACKVAHASEADRAGYEAKCASVVGLDSNRNGAAYGEWAGARENSSDGAGRWPTNLVLTHDARCVPAGTRRVKSISERLNPTVRAARDNVAKGSEKERRDGARGYGNGDGTETVEAWSCVDSCPVAELDRQSGGTVSRSSAGRQTPKLGTAALGDFAGTDRLAGHDDTGGASRFYPVFRYQAKAPASERPRLDDGTAHPTVKSLELARWMCRPVVPTGGTVLDMFAGSGPVGEAAIIEGFRCVLIEQDPKSCELIKTRLSKPIQPTLFGLGEAS